MKKIPHPPCTQFGQLFHFLSTREIVIFVLFKTDNDDFDSRIWLIAFSFCMSFRMCLMVELTSQNSDYV